TRRSAARAARSAAVPPRSGHPGTPWSTRERVRLRPSGAHLRTDRTRAAARRAEALGLRADEDGDLAQMLVLVHRLVRLGDTVEGHGLPQHGTDLAGFDQLVRPRRLVGVREVAPDDLLLAHPEVADVEVELVARGRPADDDLAERLDREDRRGEGRAADVLEHDVGLRAEQ